MRRRGRLLSNWIWIALLAIAGALLLSSIRL